MVPLQYFNPVGRMHAANWDSTTRVLKDAAAPGVQSSLATGDIRMDKQPGNGATIAQTYLYGPTTASIVFPVGWLPSTFTLCTMTRYNGPTKQRIMQCLVENLVHGHYGGKPGPVFYGNTFVSADATINTDPLIWLVVCAKSNGGAPNNVVANGKAIGAIDKVYNLPATAQLAINTGLLQTEVSDWTFAHAMAWNRALSDSEMADVSNVMWEALNDESIDIVNQRRCGCNVPAECEMCQAGKYKSAEGSSPCSLCPVNTFSSAAASTCTPCIANSSSDAGSSSCLCHPGFTGSMCTTCPAGTYKQDRGSAPCTPCASGSFSAGGETVCIACSAGKYLKKADGGTEANSCTIVSGLVYACACASMHVSL